MVRALATQTGLYYMNVYKGLPSLFIQETTQDIH
jgi:hypothetical protein